MFKAKRTTLKVSAAGLAVTVAAVSLLLSRSDDQLFYVSLAGASNPASESQLRPDSPIPGAGTVDRPLGPMRIVEPFRPPAQDSVAAVGKPMKVGGFSEALSGWVAWDDMYPTAVPAEETGVPPMVPITDSKGVQIAWWAPNIGWISFDEILSPGFDYRKLYAAYTTDDRESVHELDSVRAAKYQGVQLPGSAR